jgi:hypothetical protein
MASWIMCELRLMADKGQRVSANTTHLNGGQTVIQVLIIQILMIFNEKN